MPKAGVDAERFRQLALALEGATEVAHFERSAFRTTRRIFATLAADGSDVNFMLEPEHQAVVVAAHPEAFEPVAGGWGRMGATRCRLGAVRLDVLTQVLRDAHARAVPAAGRGRGRVTKGSRGRRPTGEFRLMG